MNKKFFVLSFIFISCISFASVKVYSLEGILRHAGYIGVLNISGMVEHKKYKEINCGYTYTFESKEINADVSEVWSNSQLSINQSYYVVGYKPEYEMSAILERFNRADGNVQEKLRQDIENCVQYIRSFEIVLLPESTFEIILTAKKQYAQLEYSIVNDTDILPRATLGCSFKERFLSEQINLKCFKVMIEDTLQKKHKSIYSQLFQNPKH